MTMVMKNFGLSSLLVLLAGCGTSAANSGSNSGENDNALTAECAKYQDCSEQCFCMLQDTQKCADICFPSAGAGGSAFAVTGSGGASYGAGGSGSTIGAGGTDVTGAGGETTGAGGDAAGAGGDATGTGGGGPTTMEKDISTVQFPVAVGGQDVYKCQNFANPFGEDIAILESDSAMSPGSHHMFVFHSTSYTTDTNAVVDCSGTEFSDFLHSAQTPTQTITYPPGVGRFLSATEGLQIMVHYINLTEDTITGQVTVKFHYVPRNQVQYLAEEMFLNQALLTVPIGSSTQSATYTTPFASEMISGVSHMHARAVGFNASTNTGTTLYACSTGDCWNEPKPEAYSPPIPVPANTTITWSCMYDNNTGNTLTFGESAATNEMCIFSGIFYTTDMSHQGQAMNSVVGLGGF